MTLFGGGMGDARNFQTFLVLPVTFFPSQVFFPVHALFTHIFMSIFFFIGSAVAVERIFSGGRDTISLCRASLKPETIRKLMLVKRRLLLKRKAASHR